MRYLLLSATVILVLLACRSTPEVAPPELADTESTLPLAARAVYEIDDPLIRAELLLEIAASYREKGDTDDMTSLATESLRLAVGEGASEAGLTTRLAAASLLVQADAPEPGLFAIVNATDLIVGIQTESVRARLLVAAVDAALVADEPGRAALRRAVDEVYVLEDPGLRAATIIEIARRYQSRGEALSVTSLINQAIPAVRSISSPARRALLFGQLAELASTARETPLSDRLVDVVAGELASADLTDTDSQAQIVRLVEVLSRIGRTEVAAVAASRLQDPPSRSEAHAHLAGITNGTDRRQRLLEEAVAIAVEQTAAPRTITTIAAVGRSALEAGYQDLAADAADEAWTMLRGTPSFQTRADLISPLASLFADLDRLDFLSDYLASLEDPFLRGSVAIQIAGTLIESGRLGIADDFLIAALEASDLTQFLPDALRVDIVVGFARTGSHRLAVRTIERMTDSVALAEAVTRFAVIVEAGGGAAPDVKDDLRSVLE